MKPLQIALGIVLGIALTSVTFAVVQRHRASEPRSECRAPQKPHGQKEISVVMRENDRLRAELDVARHQLAAVAPRAGSRGNPEVGVDPQGSSLTGSPSKGDETKAKARSIYCVWAAATKAGRPDPELERKLLATIAELKPELAPWFIKRYQSAQEADERDLTMNLALACGGMDLTHWITALLNDPGTSPGERTRLLGQLVSGAKNPFSCISPSQELTQIALALVRSQDSLERAAGAGLLGTTDAPQSLLELRLLLESEPEAMVRVAAIRALGQVGDSTSLEYLKQLAKVPELLSTPELKRELEKAILGLERKVTR